VYRLPRNRGAEATGAERVLLSYSGIISSRDGQRLTLRTRIDGEIPILLRDDTKLVYGGKDPPAENLLINTRVFLRGSRNSDGFVEAYEIVWGSMLEPGEPRD
jgi:hypothetical protein